MSSTTQNLFKTHSLDLEEAPAEESVSDNILDDAFKVGQRGRSFEEPLE